MPRLVSYRRVSTKEQGESGLGLAAQAEAVRRYAERVGGEVIAGYVEVESGKHAERPELRRALHHAKVTGAVLIVAKLDRLSRNAAFLLTLRDSGVRFVAADMPDANELTVGIMALVAEQERRAIGARTREALAAAKARGQVLGNPNGAAALRRAGKGNKASRAAASAKAGLHAEALREVVAAIRAEGVATLAGLAAALNERGMLTPRGGRWHPSSAANLVARLAV